MTERKGAQLREIDVRTSDGRVWTAKAVSTTDFERLLKVYRSISVDPSGTKDTGWRVATAHVVAWKLDD